jgi:formate--tetrahydrofolate ligase
VVALNRFEADTDAELDVLRKFGEEAGVPCVLSEHFAKGGEGAEDLADAVVATAESATSSFKPMYDWKDPILTKIEKVARKVYGARAVVLADKVKRDIKHIERLGLAELPICVAKTHSSLSDDPKIPGRPTGFDITVKEIVPNAGAGFLVVLTGDIMRMPGLPRVPRAADIRVDDGEIVGLG